MVVLKNLGPSENLALPCLPENLPPPMVVSPPKPYFLSFPPFCQGRGGAFCGWFTIMIQPETKSATSNVPVDFKSHFCSKIGTRYTPFIPVLLSSSGIESSTSIRLLTNFVNWKPPAAYVLITSCNDLIAVFKRSYM